MKHILDVSDLSKSYTVDGNELRVLQNIDLQVEPGECVAIVGNSGCGKSTLLKIIAGLIAYETGRVLCNGQTVTGPGIDRGVVFQDHRLLPWLTIEDNVGFGLKQISRKEKQQIVLEYLKMVNLDDFKKAYPHQLSGGMSQRAAIARALAGAPQILLMDEPFGALDALTRITLQQEMIRIRREQKKTVILITHDIDEAVFLGNRVIIMSERPGRILKSIAIELPLERNRASTDFSYYVNKVYKHFFHEKSTNEEYNI